MYRICKKCWWLLYKGYIPYIPYITNITTNSGTKTIISDTKRELTAVSPTHNSYLMPTTAFIPFILSLWDSCWWISYSRNGSCCPISRALFSPVCFFFVRNACTLSVVRFCFILLNFYYPQKWKLDPVGGFYCYLHN